MDALSNVTNEKDIVNPYKTGYAPDIETLAKNAIETPSP